MHFMESSHSPTPDFARRKSEQDEAMTILENQIPNYAELFGSPDICECEHCRSVYSAAAYFVELLRFLSRGDPNRFGMVGGV